MNHAFFWADPTELGVGGEVTPGAAPVGGEGGEVLVENEGGEKVDGGADELVAAADGECLVQCK